MLFTHARNDIKYLKSVQLMGCYGDACQHWKYDSPCNLFTNQIVFFNFVYGAYKAPPVISPCIYGCLSLAQKCKLTIQTVNIVCLANFSTQSGCFCRRLLLIKMCHYEIPQQTQKRRFIRVFRDKRKQFCCILNISRYQPFKVDPCY